VTIGGADWRRLAIAGLASASITWTVEAQPILSEVLDEPVLVWSTGGSAEWFGVADETAHDGEDAAQSGDVDNAQVSWVETTLTGPGVLSFWCKASSEAFYDFLEVLVNGEVWREISGEQDWSEVILDLPEGAVTVRWQYRKDESYSEGADAAWLDAVAFTPTSVEAPTILTQPADRSITSESDAFLTVEVSGTEVLHYQWQLNGTNVVDGPHFSGATHRVLQLVEAQTNQAGLYSVTVSNSAGLIVSSNALVTINSPVPLATALDTPTLTWTTGGGRSWAGQETSTHDGVDAAQSGAIVDEQQTWMETIVQGPGVLRFWWKVSSEESFDEFQFHVDGFEQAAISGEVDWSEGVFHIPAGPHTLRWTYAKDIDTSGGQDLAWLDEVSFVAYPQAIAYPATQTAGGGATVVLHSIVSGSEPFWYQWSRNGLPLPAATNASLTLTNVTRSDSGAYALTVTSVIGSTVTSNAMVVVRVPQQLSRLVRQPDGSVLLSSRDRDGGLLQPQHLAGFSAWATTDFLTWEPLPGSLSVSNGSLHLHDTNAAGFTRRFYQIREP
jgi:hypothetical protein